MTALRSELANIRSSIKLFKMLNGHNPGNLSELTEKEIMLPARIGSNLYSGSIFNRKYLVPNAVDQKGHILDAFGNRFQYNPVNAEVKASTKGYEDW